MSRYTATLLRLPKETHEQIKARARSKKCSVSALMREALEQYLSGARVRFGEDPVEQMIGCVETGERDESVNHDHYLYGWAKERSVAHGGHQRVAGAGHQRRPAPSKGPRVSKKAAR